MLSEKLALMVHILNGTKVVSVSFQRVDGTRIFQTLKYSMTKMIEEAQTNDEATGETR